MKNTIMILILTVFTVNTLGATTLVPKRDLGVDCNKKLAKIEQRKRQLTNPRKDYDDMIAKMLLNSSIENYEQSCGTYEGK